MGERLFGLNLFLTKFQSLLKFCVIDFFTGEKMKKFVALMFVFIAFMLVSCGGGSSSNGEGGFAGGPRCGNGKIEGNEVCDGDVSCGEAGHFYPEGTAKCKSDCSAYDTGNCIARQAGDKCGNGKIDSGESCEVGDTKSCKEISSTFAGGDAACRNDCFGWELSTCVNGGTKTCAQILTCVKECAGDAACENTCKTSGTEDGKAGFSQLEGCAAACGGVTDEECLINSCYNAYYSCNPGMKCGNGKIDDGEICEKKETKPCQELDTDDQKWQPINEAVCNSECKGWDTYSCVDINSLTCYQVYECIKECTDSECEQACLGKTWPAAKAKYDAMKECFITNECAVEEECMTGVCKFQTDSCKTHLTCGNSHVDKDMGEICEKNDFVDCGTIKDDKGEAMYEAGTGSAFCGSTCTEYNTMLCFRFCSCTEVQTCIEQECGGYPKSNAENTDEKKKCMDECEDWGNQVGKKQASAYRELVENCSEQNGGATAWDSDGCKNDMPAQYDWQCDSGNDPKCPY